MGVSEGATSVYRQAVFVRHLMPIIVGYKRTQMRAKKRPKQDRDAMWDEAHKRAGVQISHMLASLLGVYCKGAQDLCTRGMLVPEHWVNELKWSWEKVPPKGWEQVFVMVTTELRSTKSGAEYIRAQPAAKKNKTLLLEGVFARFDKTPIASASIGQVHSAVLKAGGDRVVVKLVYAEIKQTMDVDLNNMRRGMLLAMDVLKVKANPMPIVNEIYKSFPTECNFMNELDYLNSIKRNMAQRGGKIVVPDCYAHLSTENMLVLNMLDGRTFSKLKSQSMSPAELLSARNALLAVIDEIGKEILLDGLFQYAKQPLPLLRNDLPPTST
jgi:aarF domain-containing kinase